MACLKYLPVLMTFALYIKSAAGVIDCPDGYFNCERPNGTFCVPNNWQCNGKPDCGGDGYDEKGCNACNPALWTCKSSTSSALDCIDSSRRCDGISDCADGSDEQDCVACRHCMWTCKSSTCSAVHCIDDVFWCDGHADCEDGSDEQDCERMAAPKLTECQMEGMTTHMSPQSSPVTPTLAKTAKRMAAPKLTGCQMEGMTTHMSPQPSPVTPTLAKTINDTTITDKLYSLKDMICLGVVSFLGTSGVTAVVTLGLIKYCKPSFIKRWMKDGTPTDQGTTRGAPHVNSAGGHQAHEDCVPPAPPTKYTIVNIPDEKEKAREKPKKYVKGSNGVSCIGKDSTDKQKVCPPSSFESTGTRQEKMSLLRDWNKEAGSDEKDSDTEVKRSSHQTVPDDTEDKSSPPTISAILKNMKRGTEPDIRQGEKMPEGDNDTQARCCDKDTRARGNGNSTMGPLPEADLDEV